MSEIIILRSVFGKVGQSYTINPCINPNTGMYPEHVKSVDRNGDMILSEKDKASGKILIKETEEIVVADGTTFDLKVPIQKARWEAIQYSSLIAPERSATNSKGEALIDGNHRRYGTAVLYIDRPGEENKVKNSKKKLVTIACGYIFNDSKENQITKCKLLGKNMTHAYASDIEDFLVSYAERNPQKIIDLYTGSDTEKRMLFIDALNKGVIREKDGVFMYGDKITLGVTDESVIVYLKQPANQKVVDYITQDTYPEFYEKEKPSTPAKK